MKRIAIVGGGLSGLATACALLGKKEEFDVSVLESEPRPGGKIWTDKADGFLCEKGANGFLDNKPRTLELCKSLGLDPLRSNENAKKRYIFLNGKLNALPESPLAFIKSELLSWGGKLRILLEYNAPKGPDDETVADFIMRRLGSEALEKLIDPMTSGIYAGDPYRMSIKSCFPRIKELEQQYGGLLKALIKIRKEKKDELRVKSQESTQNSKLQTPSKVSVAPGGALTSFYNGAQTLTDALAGKLGDRVHLGVSVYGIVKDKGRYQLYTSRNNVEADVVILAAPAYASAEILKDFDGELSKTLSDIPYPHVSVVCFGYKKEKVGHALNGFGFLVPHIEGKKILGTLWDSSIFPNRASEGYALLRTMVGGAKSPEMAMLEDDRIISLVFDELKPILSFKTEPDLIRIYRWEKAIPQYLLGHGRKLSFIEERLKSYPGLYITGNAYRGIGMNDCVENGYKLADEIIPDFIYKPAS
ncbi:MAG: protoporphyrinogen oxidase [Nitrospirae bacterium]|nr:protoporphyrinogen oxidase [Nitrospirota bacterium]